MDEETKMEYVKPEVVDLGIAATAYGGACLSGTTAPGASCQNGGTAGSGQCTLGTTPTTLAAGPRTMP
ncbi:MAG: hypothetical protein ACPL7G_08515 [Chloroflexia bacterium]